MSLERYYRFHAGIYDATRWSFLFGRRQLLERMLALTKPTRLLEVGCGTGTNLQFLQRRLPQASLVGIDLSEEMLAVARRKLSAHSVELLRGHFPVTSPKGVFDVVLFSYALTMFNPGWERALSAAHESLGPGGTLAVVDFHDTPAAAFQRWMALNHVKVEGQLLPRLRATFPEREVAVRSAFLGTWRYFTFVGTNTRKPACGAGAVSQPSAPPRLLLAPTM